MEAGARDRHEFHDGVVRMMAGGTYSHSIINANLIAELAQRLRGGPCRVAESNLRIRIKTRKDFVYPDASIICGGPSFDPDDKNQTTILNPRVVFEVLSDSTESYDRGDKFMLYREILSLEEYVLVSQHVARVETFTRQPDGLWRIEKTFEGLDAIARIACLNVEVTLREIYRDVAFPPATDGDTARS
jgi:Uma2 family endonuclease